MQTEALARAPRLSVVVKTIVGAMLASGAALSSGQIPAPANDERKAEMVQKGADAANRHAMCVGCHGIPRYRTAFPEVYPVPRIAGQQPAYLLAALDAYASGDRSHPSMRGIAGGLSDEVARQLAQQYGALRPADPPRSARATAQGRRASEWGKEKAAQLCASCHGATGNAPTSPEYPIIAGQYREYLVHAITDYKTGRRGHPVMKAVVAQLSRRDIEEVAAWFANQPSNLHVLPK